MKQAIYTKKFSRDVKKIKKQHKDTTRLMTVMSLLLKGEILLKRFTEHKLKGSYSGRRECHIEPDWLLIYQTNEAFVLFERTGSHAELFR